uniref:Uncharacterized protein n=1 Tax=Arundo donax TaxID=35708 RepID=A0A0A9GPG7_ARUDO
MSMQPYQSQTGDGQPGILMHDSCSHCRQI